MSLTYFLTSLPKLKRHAPLEVSKESFFKLAYRALTFEDPDFELVRSHHRLTKGHSAKSTHYHVQLRRWYECAYESARTEFLREYARFSLNVLECTGALLCKSQGLNAQELKSQMTGSFDSSSKVITANFSDENLGVGQRFAYFKTLKNSLALPDYKQMQHEINTILLKEIKRLSPAGSFEMGEVIAYYFELDVLTTEVQLDVEQGRKNLENLLQAY